MKFRHEWKHEISFEDLLILRMRLPQIMKRDSHSVGNRYEIRSLYFDTPTDTALLDKINGVNRREKFRIRYYNGDTSFILLEKKSKINGLCAKESCRISESEARKIVEGNTEWMKTADRPLCRELYRKMQTQLLKPKTIVDYTREAFVYAPGNVRVTMDHHIRTGCFRTNFLDSDVLTIPAGDQAIVLEVKWDEFLPSVIKNAVSLTGRRASAFSKYQKCRIYG